MANNEITKACSACHWHFPLTHFYKDNGRSKLGVSSRCKDCSKIIARKHYNKNRDKVLARLAIERPLNKSKIAQSNKNYRERYKDSVRKRKSEYSKRPEVRARELERQREYRRANRERSNEYSRKWRREHPEERRASAAQNKFNRRNVTGTCSAEQWIAKCEFWGWRCYLCGATLTPKTTHMDHRKPLSRGGLHFPANLAPACKSCNLKKNNKTEAEYRDYEPAANCL